MLLIPLFIEPIDKRKLDGGRELPKSADLMFLHKFACMSTNKNINVKLETKFVMNQNGS